MAHSEAAGLAWAAERDAVAAFGLVGNDTETFGDHAAHGPPGKNRSRSARHLKPRRLRRRAGLHEKRLVVFLVVCWTSRAMRATILIVADVHQCPFCELKFLNRTELEFHCAEDHPPSRDDGEPLADGPA